MLSKPHFLWTHTHTHTLFKPNRLQMSWIVCCVLKTDSIWTRVSEILPCVCTSGRPRTLLPEKQRETNRFLLKLSPSSTCLYHVFVSVILSRCQSLRAFVCDEWSDWREQALVYLPSPQRTDVTETEKCSGNCKNLLFSLKTWDPIADRAFV